MKVKVKNNSRPFWNLNSTHGECRILEDGEVINDEDITWDNLARWMIPIDDDGNEITRPEPEVVEEEVDEPEVEAKKPEKPTKTKSKKATAAQLVS